MSIDTIWPVVGAESHAYPHGHRSGWDVPMCSAIMRSASSRSCVRPGGGRGLVDLSVQDSRRPYVVGDRLVNEGLGLVKVAQLADLEAPVEPEQRTVEDLDAHSDCT